MPFWRTIQLSANAAVILIAISGISGAVQAQPRAETPPDWPCAQVFVPSLSPATIWAGPPVDEYLKTWTQNSDVAAVATRAVSRSVPDDEATQAVENFAEGVKGNREE